MSKIPVAERFIEIMLMYQTEFWLVMIMWSNLHLFILTLFDLFSWLMHNGFSKKISRQDLWCSSLRSSFSTQSTTKPYGNAWSACLSPNPEPVALHQGLLSDIRRFHLTTAVCGMKTGEMMNWRHRQVDRHQKPSTTWRTEDHNEAKPLGFVFFN